jgi:hypothetical protein
MNIKVRHLPLIPALFVVWALLSPGAAHAVTTLKLAPSTGIDASNVASNVCTGAMYQCVDDTTTCCGSPTACCTSNGFDNDGTYVYKYQGTSGYHTVAYSSATSGVVSKVTIYVVAATNGGAGTVTLSLYDGNTLIGIGQPKTLTSTYTQFNSIFNGLSISSISNIRTRVTLDNTGSSTGSLKYSTVWIQVDVGEDTDLPLPPEAITVADLDEVITKTDGSDVVKTINGVDVRAGSCTGACAGTSGSPDAVYSVANNQASPSKDGNSSLLTISQSPAWSNDLFWLKLGPHDDATHFQSDFWMYPTSSVSSAYALEYDIFQFLGGRGYMWGTQCNLSKHTWQVDTQNGQGWVDLPLTCGTSGTYNTVFSPNVWHHIKWRVERLTDGSNKCRFVALSFDGVVHTLNWEQTGKTSTWNTSGFQFQQDTNGSGTGWAESIDLAQLSYW